MRAPIVGRRRRPARGAAPTSASSCPVDCPLRHRRPLLLELGEAADVAADRGPLPGAYAKAMLPSSSAGVARGRAVARGASTRRVLELDERLLANVNSRGELLALVGGRVHERGDR